VIALASLLRRNKTPAGKDAKNYTAAESAEQIKNLKGIWATGFILPCNVFRRATADGSAKRNASVAIKHSARRDEQRSFHKTRRHLHHRAVNAVRVAVAHDDRRIALSRIEQSGNHYCRGMVQAVWRNEAVVPGPSGAAARDAEITSAATWSSNLAS